MSMKMKHTFNVICLLLESSGFDICDNQKNSGALSYVANPPKYADKEFICVSTDGKSLITFTISKKEGLRKVIINVLLQLYPEFTSTESGDGVKFSITNEMISADAAVHEITLEACSYFEKIIKVYMHASKMFLFA